jgi:septal ring factor EnvC (AmiA/AmiB activator)
MFPKMLCSRQKTAEMPRFREKKRKKGERRCRVSDCSHVTQITDDLMSAVSTSTPPPQPQRRYAQTKEHVQKRVEAYKRACAERFDQRKHMEQELKRLRTDHQTMKANIGICARILGEIYDNVLGELKRIDEMKMYIESVAELTEADPFEFQTEVEEERWAVAEEIDEPKTKSRRQH